MAAATQTYNSDVFSICRRLNRFIFEMVKSQSSGVSQTMPFDVTRVRSYISSLESFIAWVVAQPLLDLPETGPQLMDLPEPIKLPPMENESVYDIVVLFDIAREELAGAQSSRLSTNLIKFDHDRLLATLTKITNLCNYIEASEPLDLPESSPLHAMTGPGRTGV